MWKAFTYWFTSYIQTFQREGVRHNGHVFLPCLNHLYKHIVWNAWEQSSVSVPHNNGIWQMLQISVSIDTSFSTATHLRSILSNNTVCAIFKCQKAGHSDDTCSCKNRWNGGLLGCTRIHSFNLVAIESVETVGGAQISNSIS